MSEHGTPQRYWSKCRCIPCRDAHKAYERERLAKKRAARGEGLPAIPKMWLKPVVGWDTFTREEILRSRGIGAA
jgi:hypothetical protein